MRLPRIGKRMAAKTLKKKITEMDWATSSSSASITGAVAAMAEPPQMEEPTPTKVEILEGIRRALCSTKAMSRETAMVQTMMGRDCLPVFSTTVKSRPNPRSTTAHCSTFLEVNLMPGAIRPWFFRGMAISMPRRMAMTGPPTMGKKVPKIQAGTAMARHRAIPRLLVLKNSITGSFLSLF